MKNQKFKIAIAIIINNKGEILLSKRAREPFKNKWALISGIGASQIYGLPPEKGVIQEVEADLGTSSFKGTLFISIRRENDPLIDEIAVFVGTINEEEITMNPLYSAGIKWVPFANKKEFRDLAFEHSKILQQYLESK